jgi:hypothetical protein
MKQLIRNNPFKAIGAFILLTFLQLKTYAQDAVDVNINEEKVGSWFERNWMWVVGGVLLIILIAAFSGGTSRRRTDTIVRDDFGNTKRVTTTETES